MMEICREKWEYLIFFPNDHLIIINSIKTEGLLSIVSLDILFHVLDVEHSPDNLNEVVSVWSLVFVVET